jgi:predicted ATPase/class 3 adenylate cyclase
VALPTGTVTFCMTDIEGSTRLLAELGDGYGPVLQAHRGIVRDQLARHDGVEVETEGDAFFCVFLRAIDAVRAAVEVQRCLAAHPWPDGTTVRVRIGLHTGEGVISDGGYIGLDVHEVARVSAAGHGGQVLLTAATHALLEGHWPAGVGDEPVGVHSLKDLPAPVALFQVVADGLERRFPPLRTLERPDYELPATPSPLFGRDEDVRAVRAALADHRLVTLTGPGGVGKTRLALQVAGLARGEFPDGVVFVPLAEIRDPELLPDEVARALALPAASFGTEGVDRLVGHLRGRRMLLVLDNVEQLGDGAEVIGRLLDAGPELRLLTTSRGPLRLREEQAYPVPPLARDAASDQFVERALAACPDLRLGPAERDAVVRIVDGVGGMPLAVELAAARVRTLDPVRLADRLGSQLRLLAGGPRDLPRRQQALRSTLVWSYELLDEPTRWVFAALAVFPGGATLDALEDVLAGGAADVDVLTSLEALVDQGLLRRSPLDAGRFETLQVVRELAAELLADTDEGPRIWRRAAERLADLAAETGPRLTGMDRVGCLERLEGELENVRAALAWATEVDPPLAARVVAPVWRFWQMRGRLREAHVLLEQLRDRLPEGRPEIRHDVLTALGGIAYWQDDLPAEERAYTGAVAAAEEAGDKRATAEALYNLGFTLWQRERGSEADALADRAQAMFEQLGDRGGVARVLWLRGLVALMGHRLEEAEARFVDSIERLRGGADVFSLGWALRMLGRTLVLQGRADDARQRLDEGLRLLAPGGDVSAIVLHLCDFAALAALEGDVEREVRLVGAVRRLQEATGTDLVDHPNNAIPGIDDTLARLGTEADRLLAEGAAMTDDEVVAYALRDEPAAT